MSENDTEPVSDTTDHPGDSTAPCHALVLAWSATEPHRAGEIAFLPEEERSTLGRGETPSDPPKLRFFRQRPGSLEPRPPLSDKGIPKDQIVCRPRAFGVLV